MPETYTDDSGSDRRILRDGIAQTAMDVVRKTIAHHEMLLNTQLAFLESLKGSLSEMEVLHRDLSELESKIDEAVVKGRPREEMAAELDRTVAIRQELLLRMHHATLSLVRRLQPDLFTEMERKKCAGA